MDFRRSTARAAIIFLVHLTGFAAPTGSVSGMVKDPSGAPVPGVRLMLVNDATRAQRMVTSGANGAFEFPQLEPGRWSLSAEARGFKRAEIPEVITEVDRTTHLAIALQLGDASEVVEVNVTAPLLEMHKSTLSGIIPTQAIANVPLNRRQFLDLALLAPGVIPAAPGTQ